MGFATANLVPRSISAVWLAQQSIKYNLPVTKTAAAYSQPGVATPPVVAVYRPQPYTPPVVPVVTNIVPPAPLPQVQETLGQDAALPTAQPRGMNRCGITNPVAEAGNGGENRNTVARPVTATTATETEKRDKFGAALALGGAIMSLLSL